MNDAVRILTDTLLELFRVSAPETRSIQSPPWSNQVLRTLKRKRAKALRQYNANRNIATKQKFQIASNRYRNYNRQLYSYYVRQRKNDLRRNPKKFWTFVNEKRKESGLPSVMSYGTETASSSAEIYSFFANHFSSVFKPDIASSQHIVAALRNVPQGILGMQNIVFSEAEICDAIVKLKSSCQPGPDGIPPIVFKKCALALCAPLTALCNQSMAQSVFPVHGRNPY